MGFDISFHPVDLGLIHDRILPFVAGGDPIDDLVEDAVRISKVRFHANAWGLGLLKNHHNALDKARSSASGGLIAKLFRKRPPPQTEGPTPEDCGFNSEVHVWGRPFFIHADSAEGVSAMIDRYLVAQVGEVEAIARENLANLHPDLVGQVEPSFDGELPADDEIAHSVRWKLDLFRKAYQCADRGEPVSDPEGNQHDPKQLFVTDFTMAVIEFHAHLRPGWMARGHGWPSHLLAVSGAVPETPFVKSDPIFAPLLEARPEIAEHLSNTITDNFTLGGFIPAENIAAVHRLFESHADHINAWARNADWGDDGAAVYLNGIGEALTDAHRRGSAFVEASEIYSAPMGVMN